MIALLSPSKSMATPPAKTDFATKPRLLTQSRKLVSELKSYEPAQLQSLMSISEKLADLNWTRYQEFKTPFKSTNAQEAIFAFQGDVYTGLQAEEFDEADLNFAQKHLRILSGLYGLLRPLDLIQAYRLEMGTKLPTEEGKNLYEFWNDRLAKTLKKDLKEIQSKVVINLASNEYFEALKKHLKSVELYDIKFLEKRGEQYKFISFNAKKARGLMAHFMIKHQLTKPMDLRGFDLEDYTFNEAMSSEQELVFTR